MIVQIRPGVSLSLSLAQLAQNKLALLGAMALSYVILLAVLSWTQFVQFTLNGLVVGSIYSILALGFTLVFSTVWFFDLAYGVLPAVGAYVIFNFHLVRAAEPNPYLAAAVGLIVAGSVAWLLFASFYNLLSRRIHPSLLIPLGAAVSALTGVYLGFMLTHPAKLYLYVSPLIGALVAASLLWALVKLVQPQLLPARSASGKLAIWVLSILVAAIVGAYCGLLLSETDDANLPLSSALSVIIAGFIGLSLYRGLYYYLRRRARSPLIMIVCSLGVLLLLQAVISIIFSQQPQPFPVPFGANSITVLDAYIKPFQIFKLGISLALLFSLVLMLKKTLFGKAVRAIGDDEHVAQVVGINTQVVIAGVFFLGAAIAALAGILLALDLNTIEPRMGFRPLFKGWIAAVVGGTGNFHGAWIGGLLLGLVENYGIWFLAGEWKDSIAFVLFILFLLLRPRGLLPRR